MRAKFLVSRLLKLVISRGTRNALFLSTPSTQNEMGMAGLPSDFICPLQLEGLEGPILRSDQQLAVEGGFGSAAVERLFCGKEGEVRIVVLLREMREHQIARMSVKTFGIREIFADSVIRQVSSAGKNALLDDPRIRPDFKHIQIVI